MDRPLNRFFRDREESSRASYFSLEDVAGRAAGEYSPRVISRYVEKEGERHFSWKYVAGEPAEASAAENSWRQRDTWYFRLGAGKNPDGSVAPTAEFGVGDRTELELLGLEYENRHNDSSPYILVNLSAVDSSLSATAKIYSPADHEGVTRAWTSYVAQVQSELIAYMNQQQPGAEIKGFVTLVNAKDNVILNQLRLSAFAEEISHYEVLGAK